MPSGDGRPLPASPGAGNRRWSGRARREPGPRLPGGAEARRRRRRWPRENRRPSPRRARVRAGAARRSRPGGPARLRGPPRPRRRRGCSPRPSALWSRKWRTRAKISMAKAKPKQRPQAAGEPEVPDRAGGTDSGSASSICLARRRACTPARSVGQACVLSPAPRSHHAFSAGVSGIVGLVTELESPEGEHLGARPCPARAAGCWPARRARARAARTAPAFTARRRSTTRAQHVHDAILRFFASASASAMKRNWMSQPSLRVRMSM